MIKHVSFSWFLEGVSKRRCKESLRWRKMHECISRQKQIVGCRIEGLCRRSWLKVSLLSQPSMQREHNKVRGSRGTGNNERESLIHFLGLAFGL